MGLMPRHGWLLESSVTSALVEADEVYIEDSGDTVKASLRLLRTTQ